MFVFRNLIRYKNDTVAVQIGRNFISIFFIRKQFLKMAQVSSSSTIGFFTNSPQYKNANIANSVLTLPLEISWTNEVCNIEI